MNELQQIILSAIGGFVGITLYNLIFTTQVMVIVNPGDLWEEFFEEEE